MKIKIFVAAALLTVLLGGCAVPSFIAQVYAPTEPPTYYTEYLLSAEDAKAIALDHARLSADQVTGLYAELGYDDGRPEYEIQFRYNNREYEYEIHGESGRIISFDRDD